MTLFLPCGNKEGCGLVILKTHPVCPGCGQTNDYYGNVHDHKIEEIEKAILSGEHDRRHKMIPTWVKA